jgi:hypothetical protein
VDDGESSIEGIGQGLTKAVADWLAERKENWGKQHEESLMGEALLMVPVVDHLIKVEKWKTLAGEHAPYKGYGDGVDGGAANFDLYAGNGSHKVLIEWKYIKKRNDQRIIKDFVKLALPGSDFSVRFMLVVNWRRSSLLGNLVGEGGEGEKGRATFNLTHSPCLKITSRLCEKGHSITGREKNGIEKILRLDSSLRSFSVEKMSEVGDVSIFAVSRVW